MESCESRSEPLHRMVEFGTGLGRHAISNHLVGIQAGMLVCVTCMCFCGCLRQAFQAWCRSGAWRSEVPNCTCVGMLIRKSVQKYLGIELSCFFPHGPGSSSAGFTAFGCKRCGYAPGLLNPADMFSADRVLHGRS